MANDRNDLNQKKSLSVALLPNERLRPVPALEREGDLFPNEEEENISSAQQLNLLGMDEIAFDEMNLIETPFALLTKDTDAVHRLELSRNGERYLVPSSGGLLPSALAEQAVLGLMWLAKRQNGFRSPTIRFALRDLVSNYMYPGRFAKHKPPNGDLLKSVEEQLKRVAHTRIVTDKWYDKKLQRHTPMDAAVIDYIQVIDVGGRNRSRILEIRWGEKFFQSVRAHYTKSLDPRIYFEVSKPLDRRLFRWLDRQLSPKPKQRIGSIQEFAKYKLAMTGQKIDAGGRTASGYIARRLKESLERLDGIGFPVRMTIDSSQDDFALEFERLSAEKTRNEVVEEDPFGDLVRHFYELAHGVEPTPRQRRIPEADRRLAQEWIQSYGEEQARWMVKRSVEIQTRQGAERILTFRGLSRYEMAALGDYQRELTTGMQQPLELKPSWQEYRDIMLGLPLSDELAQQIEAEARQEAEGLSFYRQANGTVQENIFRGLVASAHMRALNLIEEEVFNGISTAAHLRECLVARHGFDPFDARNSALV